ncbi:hypothetical protein B0H67DRAFT_363870 [Lasiosphaeris hirsuta]|uniref:Secreted protein n=1 Tax=Lasiosphaeris hirsuta TaxID=260670 RepID=A0AA39ZWF9_9PEZI|nr:hypothetical protein B0H67DRAFT_363870 [Lasiosphaeris hirsuta]
MRTCPPPFFFLALCFLVFGVISMLSKGGCNCTPRRNHGFCDVHSNGVDGFQLPCLARIEGPLFITPHKDGYWRSFFIWPRTLVIC